MEQAFGRIAAVFTAVVMFFLVPVVINMQRQENLIQLSIMQDTVQFVDSVRNMGVLTDDMFERYQNKIRSIQGGLEISMVHSTDSLFMGAESIEHLSVTRTEDEIINGLETDGEYVFQMGDYFRVEVKKNNSGYLGMLYEASEPGEESGQTIYVYYGGSVRYED